METRMQKTRSELAGNGSTEHLQQVALLELTKASFDHEHVINWQASDLAEANIRRINGFFSNLSFVHEVTNYKFCVRAIVRGSREPDRYIILSANGDGIAIALELARVLDRIHSAHDWRPRRSLIFCVSLISLDVCPQTLPTFVRRKVVAYIAIHGRFARANEHVALSGSDVMRSIAVEAIKTIPDGNWTYLEHESFGPRLSLNIPQVIFLFNDSNSASSHNQSLRSRGIILAQMVSQTIWRLSESIIIEWNPKYFNETINEVLGSIDNNKFQDVKEKLKRTLRVLLAMVKDPHVKIDPTETTQSLHVRIWNDLLLDLDKTLLCFDENLHHSRTDFATFRKQLLESNGDTLNYLDEIAKCYEDAIQVLQERYKKKY